MKKAKFVQDAKNDPARFYRNPFDVIRDRRLSNEDRLEILAAWEKSARDQQDEEDEGSAERLEQLRRVREDLERNLEGTETTTESE